MSSANLNAALIAMDDASTIGFVMVEIDSAALTTGETSTGGKNVGVASVLKNGVGDLTITYDTAFASYGFPYGLAQRSSGVFTNLTIHSIGAGSCRLIMATDAAAAIDAVLYFQANGNR